MNKLFAWDELSCEVTEREPADLFFCNAEGGWDSEGFLYGPNDEHGEAPNDYKHGDPCVEVRTNGRHIALETWCETKEEADRRFAWHERYVEEMRGENAVDE